ncbi:hypothetical protein MRB53_041291 [Persea americana]|nr:hypothetical protein MRB53_041291 [Persea americana]
MLATASLKAPFCTMTNHLDTHHCSHASLIAPLLIYSQQNPCSSPITNHLNHAHQPDTTKPLQQHSDARHRRPQLRCGREAACVTRDACGSKKSPSRPHWRSAARRLPSAPMRCAAPSFRDMSDEGPSGRLRLTHARRRNVAEEEMWEDDEAPLISPCSSPAGGHAGHRPP